MIDLKCEPGKCTNDPGCVCTTEWDPVCCRGSKTFGNQCEANCDGYDDDVCTSGACQAIGICTMEYMPLCVYKDSIKLHPVSNGPAVHRKSHHGLCVWYSSVPKNQVLRCKTWHTTINLLNCAEDWARQLNSWKEL